METPQPPLPAPTWSLRVAPKDPNGDPMSVKLAEMITHMLEHHVRSGGGTEEEQAVRARLLMADLVEKHSKKPETAAMQQPTTQSRAYQPPPFPAQPSRTPGIPVAHTTETEMMRRKRAVIQALVVTMAPDILGIPRHAFNSALVTAPPIPVAHVPKPNPVEEEEEEEEEYTEEEDEEEYDEDEDYDEDDYEEEDQLPETPGVFERLRNELRHSEQYAAGKFNVQRWVDLTREAMQQTGVVPASASVPVAQKRTRPVEAVAERMAPKAKRPALTPAAGPPPRQTRSATAAAAAAQGTAKAR
ncbi:hypothetical protein F5X68DRAFT_217669 [Plectosphaerella plurivora]|uniref:Uncharacterized protein n=1 Tax=Plectosphaerella plurivora TaxID=936078 RepID=A0A9P8V1W3_9PEZI|nr:hypothetical protein F5X68DRAFT_217669 [Plectosphaerella plurivora]